jgi:glycerol dehydrogenase
MNTNTAVPCFKTVFPGKYIQGEDVLGQLPDIIALFGKRALLLASPTVRRNILDAAVATWGAPVWTIETFAGECCAAELDRLAAAIRQTGADVLVGLGGGKLIDTAKIAADRAAIPVIIVPTIASTDAPCSGCAVEYSAAGVFKTVHYQKMNPQVVLVDVRVIANAPVRFLVAGMGDALSTWYEARSCARTGASNECGGHGTQAGLHLARLCHDTLLAHGVAAMMAVERRIVTPALHHIVEANTLLSGIGFESCGLASAHSIHNGLTALAATHAFYHGEKVAFGALAGLILTDAAPAEIAEAYRFCASVGLPTTLAAIGLGDASRDELLVAATKACAPTEGIHHEAGTITPGKVLDAMLAADAWGARTG